MKARLLTSAVILLVVAVLVILLQALGQGQNRVFEGEDRAAILAYAQPASQALIEALDQGDYAAFSANFGRKMERQFTQTDFDALRASLAPLGGYQDLSVQQVEFYNGYVITTCHVNYAQGAADFKIILSPKKAHTLEGISVRLPTP